MVATLSKEPRSAKGKTCREVDESLGIVVAHVDQVHDDRAAVTVAFTDDAGLAVVGRAQRRDLIAAVRRRRCGQFLLVAARPWPGVRGPQRGGGAALEWFESRGLPRASVLAR